MSVFLILPNDRTALIYATELRKDNIAGFSCDSASNRDFKEGIVLAEQCVWYSSLSLPPSLHETIEQLAGWSGKFQFLHRISQSSSLNLQCSRAVWSLEIISLKRKTKWRMSGYSEGSRSAKSLTWSFRNSRVTLVSFPRSNKYFEWPAENSTHPI